MRRLLVKSSVVLAILILIITIFLLYNPIGSYDEDITEDANNLNDFSLSISRDYYYTLADYELSKENRPEEVDIFDYGLDGASIHLVTPSFLPLNNTLFGNVIINDVSHGLECLLIWYLDDEILLEESIITGGAVPYISVDFVYSRDMENIAVTKVLLRYVTKQGDIHELTAQEEIRLEIYSKMHWMELEASRVLGEVSDMYKGDYTLEWALENDYDEFDKEVFVNINGYESDTDYLVWVNRSHQRANIFEGSAGNWELTEVFLVATGRMGRGTKRGVTVIPSRTTRGWHFGHFQVKPVVRFWPGTGFAMHSRILHPVTGVVTDERIGFPVSDGCVRMYCEDIMFIYETIPDGTTVVIH
ncbi:MAG: L,D-transpeptidase [Oscillospiraceae bacterium]|jgi:hypothetical protein|nr:L,D-transpeptidase [Oscillospiraceae bacterium]